MGLSEYLKKRDFSKTREPKNSKNVAIKARRFVIHKHLSKRPHFDLRLTYGKILKCWAIPKEITTTTSSKHLAIQTEDHPLSYIKFTGVIPQGEYGAGEVEIWDEGKYRILQSSFREGLKKGHIEFYIEGKKVQGAYVLHRMDDRKWLLVKMKKG